MTEETTPSEAALEAAAPEAAPAEEAPAPAADAAVEAAAAAAAAAPAKPVNKNLWYVIKAVSGRENRARENIQIQLRINELDKHVDDLLIPVEKVTEMKRGKKVTTERKLYPGYIYARMKPHNDVLEVIRNVDGVTGFLGSDPAHPEALSTDEADRIIKIASAGSHDEQRAAIIQVPYNEGDKVKVKEGTFSGMDGTVEEINAAKGTVKVLITVFGRQTPIELEVWQVEEFS